MRVSASSIIRSAADMQPTPASARRKAPRSNSLVESLINRRASLASEAWGKLSSVAATAPVQARTTANPYVLCALAWAVPGAAHLFLGRRKGIIFLVVLPAMFALGLAL